MPRPGSPSTGVAVLACTRDCEGDSSPVGVRPLYSKLLFALSVSDVSTYLHVPTPRDPIARSRRGSQDCSGVRC